MKKVCVSLLPNVYLTWDQKNTIESNHGLYGITTTRETDEQTRRAMIGFWSNKKYHDFLSWFVIWTFMNGKFCEWARNSVWMAIFVNEGNFVNEGEICAGCRCVCWRAGIPPCPPLNTAANALCTYTCPNAPKVPITWSMHDRYTALHLYWRFKRTLNMGNQRALFCGTCQTGVSALSVKPCFQNPQ